MSGITLNTDPDLTSQNGTYNLYVSRIMTLTARLVSSDDIGDDEKMMFSNVTSMMYGATNDEVGLAVYSDDPSIDVDTLNNTASVPITKTGFGEGFASLPVLVIGASGNVVASWDSMKSPPLIFSAQVPDTYVPNTFYGTYIPVSDHDMIPSEGAFIHYQFNAVDKGGAPLNKMRVRLSGDQLHMDGYWITQVLVYPGHDSKDALRCYQDFKGYCVDIVTDETGYAEAFVCPKKNTAAADEIMSDMGGTGQSAGLFFIADLQDGNSDNLPVPYPGQSIVQIDSTQQFPVYIPHYDGVANGDVVYLFCNGRYQGSLEVEDRTKDPLGHIPVDAQGLYSITYDDAQPENIVEYIAVQTDHVYVSGKGKFLAEGVLEEVHPDEGGGGQIAGAPTIPEDPHNTPINCDMVSNGIRVRVPLSGLEVQVGYVIDIDVYINGFRQWPDKNEPYGAHFGGPVAFAITPKMINPKYGYAEWWFQSSMFMGFGQNSNNDMGTFEAKYSIKYGESDNRFTGQADGGYVLYQSEVLKLAIDTIPPGGMDLIRRPAKRVSKEGAA